jgi:CheY-like chemotaxis protein
MRIEDAKVLIVDDEAALCGIFAKWLAKVGCLHIRTAGNGKEALGAIAEEPIDVLITDVRMPLMDGITLVRTLAGRGERIHTIIFVSGFGEVDQREMYDLGVEGFLSKPFRLEDLSAALINAITAHDMLWAIPMQTPPRQALRLELDAPGSTGPDAGREAEAILSAAPNFSLGRGGFSAVATEPLGLGKVTFSCQMPVQPNETRDLCGQGYVRWRSRTDTSVGIEFAFLESPGREWVVDQIAATNPRAFIPALRATNLSS